MHVCRVSLRIRSKYSWNIRKICQDKNHRASFIHCFFLQLCVQLRLDCVYCACVSNLAVIFVVVIIIIIIIITVTITSVAVSRFCLVFSQVCGFSHRFEKQMYNSFSDLLVAWHLIAPHTHLRNLYNKLGRVSCTDLHWIQMFSIWHLKACQMCKLVVKVNLYKFLEHVSAV